MPKRKNNEVPTSSPKSPRLENPVSTLDEKKLALEWAERQKLLTKKEKAGKAVQKEETIEVLSSGKKTKVNSKKERENGSAMKSPRKPRNNASDAKSIAKERSDSEPSRSSKKIESITVSRDDGHSKGANADAATNSANSVSPSPPFVSQLLVLWNAYLDSSTFVIEYIFMCAVFVGIIGYICYPDKIFASRMENDGVIKLSLIDVLSAMFAIYTALAVIFASGILPYLFCDFMLPFKKSNRLRIFSRFVLMGFFLGFIFISCWYDLLPYWINRIRS